MDCVAYREGLSSSWTPSQYAIHTLSHFIISLLSRYDHSCCCCHVHDDNDDDDDNDDNVDVQI